MLTKKIFNTVEYGYIGRLIEDLFVRRQMKSKNNNIVSQIGLFDEFRIFLKSHYLI